MYVLLASIPRIGLSVRSLKEETSAIHQQPRAIGKDTIRLSRHILLENPMVPFKALSLALLGLLVTLALASAVPITTLDQVAPPSRNIANPPPFNYHRAPVSGAVWAYLRLVQNLPSSLPASSFQPASASAALADPTIVFNLDRSPLPQNEETIATSPSAANTLIGGYNDYRGLLAFLSPTAQTGFSGFSISNNGGTTVRTDGDLPRVQLPLTISPTLSGGDPAIDTSNIGTFYYSSLYYNFSTSKFPGCPKKAPCESAVLVFPSVPSSALSSCLGTSCWGSPRIVVDTTFTITPLGGVFNDKDWVAVDRTALGSGIYVTYTAFSFQPFSSTINMVRCSYDLTLCSSPSVISGPDVITQGSFASVRTDGRVVVTYVSYDMSPVRIRGVQCSPGTSTTFTCGAPATVAGINNPLFSQSYEDFRTPTLPQMAVDYSNLHPNRVVVVWQECASNGVQGETFIILVCPQPFIRAALTDATTMAGPWTIVNVTSNGFFPTVSIDPTKGTVNIPYYSTVNDPLAHRLDLFVAQYSPGPLLGTAATTRVTVTSDEPDDDPLLGGFFFGDYIQAIATGGVLYIHYTANYAQKGSPPTFNQDNFLSTIPD